MQMKERRVWQAALILVVLSMGFGWAMAQRGRVQNRGDRVQNQAGSVEALQRKVRALETRLNQVEARSFKKKGNKWVAEFNGARIEFRPRGDVMVFGRQFKAFMEGEVDLKGGRMRLRSGSTTELKSTALMNIRSGLIKVNNGNKPAARKGDPIKGGGVLPAQIKEGTGSFLLP